MINTIKKTFSRERRQSVSEFSSVQFSRSVVSDSLRPHESQHARPPRPSPTPGVHSDSCPSSQWCNPTISSSAAPFSSFPQSFPASGSFPMSQFLASWGQSIGISASASVLPVNIQGCFPLGLTGLISLQSNELSSLLYGFSFLASFSNSVCISIWQSFSICQCLHIQ